MAKTASNNYPNPLDNFRSYSYHFIMTASSTTEFFRKMFTGDGRALLSAIQSKQLGEEFTIGDQAGFLVLDTRRFSQYTISDIDMTHMYGTGTPANPTIPTANLKMKLIDSTGISFFSFMMDMMRNKLKTSRTSAFFVLSILFVGHRDDGSTETISTCNIPLMLQTMGFAFNHKGSEYDIEFLELHGSPQRGGSHAQMNNLAQISSLKTPTGSPNTVGKMIENLEDQLNIKALQHYQKSFNEANTESGTAALKGKLVQYMISVPNDTANPWYDFTLTAADKSVTPETSFFVKELVPSTSTRGISPSSGAGGLASFNPQIVRPDKLSATASVAEYSTLQLAPSMGITDAIKLILESSQQFRELASTEKLRNGQAKAFRTLTTVTSDDTTYTIHIDIIPYYLPKADTSGNTLKAGNSTKAVLDSNSTVKNVITYDYIFSGYNSHILDLKIQYNPESAIYLDSNIDIGRARLASNAASGAVKKDVEAASKTTNKNYDFLPDVRPNDAMMIPLRTKDEVVGNAGDHTEQYSKDDARDFLKAKQEYSKTYAWIHFISNISLDMTIRGNPNIIRKYADCVERGGIPPHETIISAKELAQLVSSKADMSEAYKTTLKKQINSSKRSYIQKFIQPRIDALEKSRSTDDAVLNKIDVSALPLLVKINLFAPDVDWTGNFNMLSNKSNSLYSDDFFFPGPYQVLFINTKFSGGEFTHDMTLTPYPVNNVDIGKNSK